MTPMTARYKLCDRRGCGGFRAIRRPFELRQTGYCSRRCAALVNKNWRHADASAAGRQSALVRRRHTRVLIDACATKLEAFQLGYHRGLEAQRRARSRAAQAKEEAR